VNRSERWRELQARQAEHKRKLSDHNERMRSFVTNGPAGAEEQKREAAELTREWERLLAERDQLIEELRRIDPALAAGRN
jgi:predicted  nucleic acid-binding Zn-ribbon protein